MLDVPVYNKQGAKVGAMSIDEQSLGGSVNAALIKQAFVMYHANLRQGSARTKTRADVEGSTRKIYKQKGTGNARHGDKRPPQFVGGGHGHAKKRTREDYHLSMPVKMRRRANRNALLSKIRDQEIRVMDSLAFAAPRTKDFVAMIEALKLDRAALVALSMDAAVAHNARMSARNVEDVTLCRLDQLTAFNMLNHRYLVIAKADLEAWLKGPSSQTTKAAKVTPMNAAPKRERKPATPRGRKAAKAGGEA